MGEKFFVINPGSTSTKLAVFEDDRQVFTHTIDHSIEELAKFDRIYDQFDYRYNLIMNIAKENGIDFSSFSAIVARGGNMKPVRGGTYLVNDEMLEDLKIGVMGQHACNLGGGLAAKIANKYGMKAYIVDPVVVDEFEPLARISGSPLIERKSKDHPLNQKAVAREAAKEAGCSYKDMNLIVAHMGGGISIGVHKKGCIVDVNNSLNGDGPMSPNRSGGLPFGSVIDLCFSGKYTKKELMDEFVGHSGLAGYLGTNDGRTVVSMINSGDENARTIYQAMAYQIAKEIAAGASVLFGDVDCICLTGGLAYDELIVDYITERVKFIAPVKVFPGEYEMVALARGVLRILQGTEDLQEYPNASKQ